MAIDYDASRSALYSPEHRETLFTRGSVYSPLQLAIESARLAYVRAEVSASERDRLTDALARVGFGAPAPFLHVSSGSQAFGSYREQDRVALIAFRGTQPDDLTDLAVDLDARPMTWKPSGGRVHAGFGEATLGLQPQIQDWLDRTAAGRESLIMTGHSLGAALATLCATIWRPTSLVTLGSPRVGDAQLAATLAGVPATRIVDCCDVVTRVPPELAAYTHVGPATYIRGNGTTVESPDARLVADDQHASREDYLLHYAWRFGTVLLRDLADHAPINYARAFFP